MVGKRHADLVRSDELNEIFLKDMATDNEFQQDPHDLEIVVKQFNSKLQRVLNRAEQVDNKVERIIQ